MKTLTLEHLTPYLPYALKGYCMISPKELMYVNRIYFPFGDNDKHKIERPINGIGEGGVINCALQYFKPILRPLSDLTKEITVNGETFVPIYEMSNYTKEITEYGKSGLEWGIVNSFPYLDIIKLLKNHFDVFGLIEQGQAININTIAKD